MKTEFVKKINNSLTNHKVIWSVLIGLAVSISCLFHTAYQDIDNNIISLILNQYYGSDNYCMHMNYFFCRFILLINRIFPYADGYVLICHSFYMCASVWLSYLILSNTDSIRKRFFFVLLFFVAYNGYIKSDLSNQNFTVSAAGMSLVGIISIWFGIKWDKKFPYILFGTIGIILGALIRIEGCLMTLPFLFLHIATNIVCSKDKCKIRQAVVFVTVPIVCLITVFAVNTVVNNSSTYKDSVQYSKCRCMINDYPIKRYENIQGEISDFSKNDYDAITQWMYDDTDRMNLDFVRDVSVKLKAKKTLGDIPIDAIIELKKADYIISLAVILVFVYLMLAKICYKRKIEAILAVVGGIAIALFLSAKGRILPRLWVIILLSMLTELSAILWLAKPHKLNNWSNGIISVVLIIVAVMTVFASVKSANPFAPALTAKTCVDNGEYEKLCHGDDLYIWYTGTSHHTLYPDLTKNGKLQTRSFIDHNKPQGDWTQNQSFMHEYYERINAKNPVKALIERDNTYYVAESASNMETYLRENVNPNAYAVQVDTIKGIPIWKFEVE